MARCLVVSLSRCLVVSLVIGMASASAQDSSSESDANDLTLDTAGRIPQTSPRRSAPPTADATPAVQTAWALLDTPTFALGREERLSGIVGVARIDDSILEPGSSPAHPGDPPSHLRFAIPGEAESVYQLASVERSREEDVWTGHVPGDVTKYAIFARHGDAWAFRVVGERGAYRSEPISRGIYAIVPADCGPECQLGDEGADAFTDDSPETPKTQTEAGWLDLIRSAAEWGWRALTQQTSTAQADAPSGPDSFVDVVVWYSPETCSRAAGDVPILSVCNDPNFLLAQLAIDFAEAAMVYTNSGVTWRYRAVGAVMTPAAWATAVGDPDARLTDLKQNNVRDANGAPLIDTEAVEAALGADRRVYISSVGITGASGSANTLENGDTIQNAKFRSAWVSHAAAIDTGYTFTHELSHLGGAGHPASTLPNPYCAHTCNDGTAPCGTEDIATIYAGTASSYVGCFSVDTGILIQKTQDIMSKIWGHDVRGPYLSNPSLSLPGIGGPLGRPITTTDPRGPADNVSALNASFPITSAVRPSVIPSVSPAVFSSPADGESAGGLQLFQWTNTIPWTPAPGTTPYVLQVGHTRGDDDIATINVAPQVGPTWQIQSATALPNTPFFVRLWTEVLPQNWRYVDYRYNIRGVMRSCSDEGFAELSGYAASGSCDTPVSGGMVPICEFNPIVQRVTCTPAPANTTLPAGSFAELSVTTWTGNSAVNGHPYEFGMFGNIANYGDVCCLYKPPTNTPVLSITSRTTDESNDILTSYVCAHSGSTLAHNMYGKNGDDLMFNAGCADPAVTIRMYGSIGNDILWGSSSREEMYSGSGADIVTMNEGNDVAYNQSGRDQTDGGPGQDEICSSNKGDVVVANLGSDLVYFSTSASGSFANGTITTATAATQCGHSNYAASLTPVGCITPLLTSPPSGCLPSISH